MPCLTLPEHSPRTPHAGITNVAVDGGWGRRAPVPTQLGTMSPENKGFLAYMHICTYGGVLNPPDKVLSKDLHKLCSVSGMRLLFRMSCGPARLDGKTGFTGPRPTQIQKY